MRYFLILLILLSPAKIAAQDTTDKYEFVVYSVYSNLYMGNKDEIQQKDFYINMGSNHGIRKGTRLVVIRRNPTYDLMNKKLYQDVAFPIATLTVIHADKTASITRLEKMLPRETTPAITPRAVMMGDIVRPIK